MKLLEEKRKPSFNFPSNCLGFFKFFSSSRKIHILELKAPFYLHKKRNTVNSRCKKDLKLQIHLHKTFFLDDWFLDSLHKSFLNQIIIDVRKEQDQRYFNPNS